MSRSHPFQILFLCTGNICRSPMAEGILKAVLNPSFQVGAEIRSAGMSAAPGYSASDYAVTACNEIGIDISNHQAQQMTRKLAGKSDLVLCMELHHLYAARQLAPDHSETIHLLSGFALNEPNAQTGVADPIGGSLEEYRESRDNINDYIQKALPRIHSLIASGALEF